MENPRYEFGPFLLSVATRSLSKGRRNIELDAIQFDLLLLLVESAGQVISKDAMIANIWEGQIVEESTIFTTIYRLRQVLKSGRSKQRQVFIRTVSKKGYCFVCPVKKLGDLDSAPAAVKESCQIEVAEAMVTPSFNQQFQELIRVVGFMDRRLQKLEFLVRQSVSAVNTRSDVIDILPDDERANVFFVLAQTARPGLIGAEKRMWLKTLDDQKDNLLASLNYYNSAEPARALEMAVNMGRFWDIRGQWSEGREVLEHALARQSPGESELKAKALTWLGHFSLLRGDYGEGKRRLSESIAVSRKIEDKMSLAISLELLGCIAHWEGLYQDARRYLTESLKVSNLDWLNVWTLRALGRVAEAETDYPTAQKWHRKALSLAEQAQDTQGMALTFNNLGLVACHFDDPFNARALIDKSLSLSHEDRYIEGIATSLFSLALAEEAIEKPRGAREYFKKSAILNSENGSRRQVAQSLEGLAKMNARLGDEKSAARVFSAAAAIRRVIAAPLTPADQKSYGSLRDSLKKKHLAQWEEGAQQQPEELIHDLS